MHFEEIFFLISVVETTMKKSVVGVEVSEILRLEFNISKYHSKDLTFINPVDDIMLSFGVGVLYFI